MITVANWIRFVLFVLMGIWLVWIDFFTKSTDYSFRGLMMPVLATLSVATTVALARTRDKTPSQPVPGNHD